MAANINREEVAKTVEAVYSGSLTKKLKNNSSYSLTGIGVGAVGGFILASFFGKNRMFWAVGGAAIGGLGGYIMGNKLND